MAFVAGDEATEVVQPGEEAFDLPAAAIAPEGAAVLRDVDAVRAVGGDELDPALGPQSFIEPIAVVGAVADQAPRGAGGEERVERGVDEGDLIRRSTADGYADRNTSAVCHCHDLGPLATPRGADRGAPFFAPA